MSAIPSERRTQALALLEWLEPGAPKRVTENLDGFHDDATEILLGFAFTDVVAREGISLKTREMLTVSMLAAMGTAPGQLEFHIRAALNTGATREEIVEIVLQVAVYAGIPASMNAITAAKSAFTSV
ncbi:MULTISPECIES: carboxymuconolactone decarboxylase family protein [Chromohalobacter]|uniref:Carboxymuconolactone decarboxylase family protein n=1 Tax=Chromohalobacter moromii TaxID=2860329 RepID=A0A9X2X1G1_9GAMM|nr:MULTISPECIES: carboxymuconolactone decarboxylase family protein [Chromohalobacter]MCK2045577.1 carboxymuconolactone decarboxylase family protein [Chromohalobacter moromii]MCT8468350.1 carboxymuconolactone decarboxylase family protein [Chromohalobacter canadensis]MCT8471405.1 carboxymuconolactone decarboxylase family protein [Chromohalobacter canadensis]MCT8498858.1 carboxymuconolactone decarboxylase family protein [Chromohalobacter canadensis]MCT8504756.1 carboxymuconolactone decarboxylase 